VSETALTRTVQLLLATGLCARPEWALWAFTLSVYACLLFRVLETLTDEHALPWEPGQLLAVPAHLYISGIAPPLAAGLLASALHALLRREGVGRGALVPTLLVASTLWVLELPAPVFRGLPSDPVRMGALFFIAIGVVGHAIEDAVRLIRSPHHRWIVTLGCGLPLLALAHPLVSSLVFHPRAYGGVLVALVLSRGR
jgi:hypothetical protein